MGKNILITGGAGFIGSNLSLDLLKKGHNVRVLDNLSEQIHGQGHSPTKKITNNIDFIKGDVRNKADWEKALDNQQIVVHLAAETGTGQSMYEIQKYVDVNINGTAIFLNYLVNNRHTVEKVIVASSRSIYGEGKYFCSNHGDVYPGERSESDLQKGDYEPKCPSCGNNISIRATDENSKIHPSSVYGITKQNQEQMVLNVCKSIRLPVRCFSLSECLWSGSVFKKPLHGNIINILNANQKW